MKQLDAHTYWINRHKKENGLATVGLKSSSEEGNYYLYKIVMEQYDKILQKLDLPPHAKVLDAGCGIGVFTEFFIKKQCVVTAVDISPDAINKIKSKYGEGVKTLCSSLNKLDLNAVVSG